MGFGVSMFVMITGIGRIFGASWKASVIGGVVQAALWYFVFGYLLQVYLPAGSIFGIAGRG
jgi:putative tricarboxylic transport membrane protein